MTSVGQTILKLDCLAKKYKYLPAHTCFIAHYCVMFNVVFQTATQGMMIRTRETQ